MQSAFVLKFLVVMMTKMNCFFRSSEIPKRDEEKEIERKARAKRARESRRSTQVRCWDILPHRRPLQTLIMQSVNHS